MPLHVAQVAGLFTSSALAVGGAVAVAIPIAIHLLTRFRRKPQAWAAMRFLLDAYHKHKRRLQLEQMLLLLVRCLIVLLLGMALAEPLLGGVARWFGARPPGRAVCIVLDDSLTSQAIGGDMKVRFELLRELALATVDQTQPSDQIMFVRSARPVDAALLTGTADRVSLRRAIESLKPRHSASGLEDALAMAAERIQADVPAGDQVDVVILSDFSMSALNVDKAVPTPITQLAARARMLAPRPQPGAANVQLLDFRPRRSVMLARAEGATSVPVELRLRRFVDDTADTLTGVVVRAFADDSDEPLIEMRREHRWSAGQRVAAVNVELPVQARGTVRLVASIEPGTAHDALDADNHRWALVELRRQFTVGIVDEHKLPDAAGFSPGDWLRIALSAQGAGTEVIAVQPGAATEEALRALDVCMVLRPDMLSPDDLRAVRAFAERGGVVWLFAPATDTPAVWGVEVGERLGMDRQIEIEPKTHEPPASPAIDTRAPRPLRLLAADWESLLRPIRVNRRLNLTSPPLPTSGEAPATAATNTWIALADQNRSPLLEAIPVGEGHVLLLTTALDPAWSNLTTKPLFVPLVHETMRGLLGDPAEARRIDGLVSGDAPALGRTWIGATHLQRVGGSDTVAVEMRDGGARVAVDLQQPGIYIAQPATVGRALPLNVDPDAGDTQAIEQSRLASWLTNAGGLQWLDEVNPAAALNVVTNRSNLGLPLLWTVLVLLIVETLLARWFSHARAGGQSWGRRILQLGRRVFAGASA